jgi:S-adenosyl-L-methionine hydrolase (adenosine-forming)
MAIITLLTDFGSTSFFPAAMKGVIMGICPDVRIVDVTHSVPEHDIVAGSYALYATYHNFPLGTIHVAVVDPGVGSERNIVAVKMHGYTFITPDNGLMSFLLKSDTPEEIFAVENSALWAKEVSPTFHGRDVFAHVAAHLAGGVPIEEVGPRKRELVRLDISSAEVSEAGVSGEIVSIDRFGNLVTNIRGTVLPGSPKERAKVVVKVSGHTINGVNRTYVDVPLGELVVYVGSTGLMEIGRNRGSARDVLGAGIGHAVKVSFG